MLTQLQLMVSQARGLLAVTDATSSTEVRELAPGMFEVTLSPANSGNIEGFAVTMALGAGATTRAGSMVFRVKAGEN